MKKKQLKPVSKSRLPVFGGRTAFRDSLFTIGDLGAFTGKFFSMMLKRPYEVEEIIWQMFILGYRSLFLVGAASFIIGMVMTMHLIPATRQFGAEEMVPDMAAISIIREIGPVITALVCSGKLGSSIGAEIGSMKVTEQLDAMAVSGIDPYHYLVVTRVLATTLCLPLLIIFSAAIALVGAFVAEHLEENMSFTHFITSAFDFFYYHDIIPSLIKAVLFGFTIGIVGCYYGYKTTKGASGVGKSSHNSVVTSSLIIFFIDFLVVEIAHLFY